MLLQYGCAFQLIEVEGVLRSAGNPIAINFTAAGQNQPVVAEKLFLARRVRPAHFFRLWKQLGNRPAQEVHTGDIKQRLQWRNQRLDIILIKTRAHAQLWLRRNNSNINGLLMFIRQSCGA
ncbi:hypothetical protein D3C73_1001610 [compost metagenome]